MTTLVGNPVRVLVVEDSDDQRDLLRAYLEKAGCAVVTVKSAEEAIPAYADSEPELAVVDLVLPGMDGWTLIDKLRAEVPDCAIAVTSVLDSRKYPDADAILPKPFTRAQILQVLEQVVPRWKTP
ncbi:MAG TPA: response regulator [Galbitalea sp.]|jgi:CheY-like chemotaxis protein|nr:response regulator [Galbitalea sp.]